MKEPWQIAAARYRIEHSETGFKEEDLKAFIHERYEIKDAHVMQFLQEEIHFPLGSTYSRNAREGSWMAPFDLISKITDFDELKEARKNSFKAFIFSIIAIIISGLALVVQIVQVYFEITVKT